MGNEAEIPCDCGGCGQESTRSSCRWIDTGHAKIDYWCDEHAPPGALTFEEDLAEWKRIEADPKFLDSVAEMKDRVIDAYRAGECEEFTGT